MIAVAAQWTREAAHIARRNAGESYRPRRVFGVVLALGAEYVSPAAVEMLARPERRAEEGRSE